MYISRLRNIRWAIIFLGRTRSLRNIKTYVHRTVQEAEEHKVCPYVPWPLCGPRNISPSVPGYFNFRPVSPARIFFIAFFLQLLIRALSAFKAKKCGMEMKRLNYFRIFLLYCNQVEMILRLSDVFFSCVIIRKLFITWSFYLWLYNWLLLASDLCLLMIQKATGRGYSGCWLLHIRQSPS
jgi:hypothetical protein